MQSLAIGTHGTHALIPEEAWAKRSGLPETRSANSSPAAMEPDWDALAMLSASATTSVHGVLVVPLSDIASSSLPGTRHVVHSAAYASTGGGRPRVRRGSEGDGVC